MTQKDLNQIILDEQASIVVISTKEKGILYVNKAFFACFPYDSIEELRMKHSCIYDLFQDLNGTTVSYSIEQWLTQDFLTPINHKAKIYNREGEARIYSIVTKQIKNSAISSSEDCYITTLHDITDSQEEIEKAKSEADAAHRDAYAKSNFLATMSHEIRTPLNGVIGFVDILSMTQLNKQQDEYIAIVQNSASSLLTIINDILDFSKIEAGSLNIEEIEYELNKEIISVVDLFTAKAMEKSINLRTRIDAELPACVLGDPHRIKQIFANLIGNAIKFTQEYGEVKINIDVLSQGKEHARVKISVNDTGIGMTKDTQNIIFSPFSQADNTISRNFGGTGLGLSICQSLANLMGTKIEFSSEYGAGSSFWAIFEFKVCDISSILLRREKSNKEKANSKAIYPSAHILVVEDNTTNQKLITAMLKRFEIVPMIANNGLDAIIYFKEACEEGKPYDLIFMDIHMPVINGIEATKDIITYEKELKLTHTPIIALSADAVYGQEQEYLNIGMDAFLSKPIERTKFDNKISEFLSKFRAEEGVDVKGVRSDKPAFPQSNIDTIALAVSEALELELETSTMLVADFYMNWEKQSIELEEAIAHDDEELICSIVHSIKGAAGSLCIDDVFNLCLNMENKQKEYGTAFAELKVILGDSEQLR